jgi:hypothetical protein
VKEGTTAFHEKRKTKEKGSGMTFPRKNTRTMVVDNCKYLWHLNDNFDLHSYWIVVKREGSNGQMLWIDPYHHDLEIAPKSVARAIRFALSKGWDPEHKKQPIRLFYTNDTFAVLPDDSVGFDHHTEKKGGFFELPEESADKETT